MIGEQNQPLPCPCFLLPAHQGGSECLKTWEEGSWKQRGTVGGSNIAVSQEIIHRSNCCSPGQVWQEMRL